MSSLEIVPRSMTVASADEVPRGLSEDAVSGVVHDLGNMIQIAQSAVRIISRDPAVRATVDLGAVIAQATLSLEQAGALVHQTFAVSRRSMEPQRVDVAECIEAIAPLLQRVSEPDVSVDFRSEPLPWVTCDRLGLQNAILNLVINARDAMLLGGVISVAAELAEGPGWPEVELTVADNGQGMPAEVAARAFEPLFTTKADGRGSGLGLATVKRFAEESRGRAYLRSRLGHGTVVTIRLPVADPTNGDLIGLSNAHREGLA